jgi:ketosteroid isomerase-like protein
MAHKHCLFLYSVFRFLYGRAKLFSSLKTQLFMTTKEIADRLVELCRKGKWRQAQEELYSQDAVSIEAEETPGFAKETKGLDAMGQKLETWNSMVKEAHSIDVSEPLVADNGFAIALKMDLTMNEGGRMVMNEIGCYRVKDGKIVEEAFY